MRTSPTFVLLAAIGVLAVVVIGAWAGVVRRTAGAGATVVLELAATLSGGFRWVADDCDW